MKTLFLLFLVTLISHQHSFAAQPPQWQWGRQALGNELDHLQSMCTDREGNILIAGDFTSDSIRFGNQMLKNSGPGNNDAFVAKYDASGNVLWARSIGGSGDDKANCVATDTLGNVYLSGYFYTPTMIVGNDTLVNAGVVGDIFLVKYDANGNLQWARRYGGAALEIPYGIVVDNAQNLVLVGRFSSTTVAFGTTTLTLKGANDVFVVKLTSSGVVLWAKGAGSGSIDEAYAVDVDAADNVYVCGHFNQNAVFGTTTLSTAGSSDIFLVKYSDAGDLRWVKRFGGNGDDRAQCLRVDRLGNCYLSGFYQSPGVRFGPDSVSNHFASGNTNAFVCKIDSSGQAVWAQGLNGKSIANGLALFRDRVTVCGTFKDDSMNYAGMKLVANGSSDFFVFECDTASKAQWLINQTAGGGSSESALALATDRLGSLYCAGDFGSHEPLTFGTDVLLPTSNSYDIFVARLNTATTEVSHITEIDDVRVYPMPANNRVTIVSRNDVLSVELYDLDARPILSWTAGQQTRQLDLDLSPYPQGVYYVRVHDSAHTVTTKVTLHQD